MTGNMRVAYGETLCALGAENPRVVALEADLGKSTMSNMFGDAYPERYFQMGIAEANMASFAAGLALSDKIPFMSTFAVFASGRPYDQIRSSICIPRLNVKICGSSAGLSDFGDGKTHQSIDDIAIMRVLPGMTVLSPADAGETSLMLRAMAEYNGPCYIRLNRNELPLLEQQQEPYRIGQMRLMRDGEDATVFATGVMVAKALEAAELLQAEGLSVKVVNVGTIKPLDAQVAIAFASGTKGVVTAEEHNIIGGLGSAICEALAKERLPISVLGIEDCFGTSAMGYDELLERYKLTSREIASRVREICQ